MTDRTPLTLVIHATTDADLPGIHKAIAAAGLEDYFPDLLNGPVPGETYTVEELDIVGGVEHNSLAEDLAAHAPHTTFELRHGQHYAHDGHYAAYVPGHPLYLTTCDADGDPQTPTDEVTQHLKMAPATMTVEMWLTIHGPDILGTHVRTALERYRT
ncbi:hypothetical protein OG612_45645 (plasmid) [Streptomyces sp. NBC_01527]|uniref:hypothetical protein n=1 Tax=Streptomyces sp. NBC_01527 TaxID=2903894 RepID=UPI002F907E2C